MCSHRRYTVCHGWRQSGDESTCPANRMARPGKLGGRNMTTTTSTTTGDRAVASEGTRWGQLVFSIICMVMIANLQYGWTLFVNPIDQKYHWGRAAIQVAFTIFVLTE